MACHLHECTGYFHHPADSGTAPALKGGTTEDTSPIDLFHGRRRCHCVAWQNPRKKRILFKKNSGGGREKDLYQTIKVIFSHLNMNPHTTPIEML
jgi:hypothetical protein